MKLPSQIRMNSHHRKNKIKLIQFSPEEKLQKAQNKTKTKEKPISSNQLYQVYHPYDKKTPRDQNKNSQTLSRIQPDEIPLQTRSKNLNGNRTVNSGQKKNRAQSSHEIKNYQQKILIKDILQQHLQEKLQFSKSRNKIDSQKYSTLRNQNKPNNHSLPKTFSHIQYVTNKQHFTQASTTRVQNQKDMTFLSRTFTHYRKQEEKTKRQLIGLLQRKLNKEEKQKLQREIRERQEEQVSRKRNENSSKKYMNLMMKYQARKTMIARNNETAQQIRERSQSLNSTKSMRRLQFQRQLQQRSRLMKQQNKQKVKQAKLRTLSRTKEITSGVREGIAKVYQCEASLQTWRIGDIDERTRFIAETIENSRKNRDTMQKVIESTREGDSRVVIDALNKTLHSNKSTTLSRTTK